MPGKADRAPRPARKAERTPAAGGKTERPSPLRGKAERAAATGGWLYGRNAVLEALRAGSRVKRVLIARTAHGEPIRQLIAEVEERQIPVELVSRERLDAATPHHQGVLGEVGPFSYAPLDRLVKKVRDATRPALLLALDGVQDPQNLGALIRTAAAVGAVGVILPEHRAAGVTPAAVKASAGNVERVDVAQVTNMARTLETLKQHDLWVVGLAADGDQVAWDADLSMPLVLVIGGEGTGLGRLVRQQCDLTVRLPMPGRIESLNASAAGSVLMYEALRQQSQRKSP